ncbi:MAG: EamA family transporter [Candidatus Odinarchaeum yellowstonii]|jgi:drug/metabolite transporter (DMT)-like permease|uniref:EamA family transporter n=1 Tax=Odinarchaeota yellowstonii (strain LCB_4) TaxID=1841599 RepID=A0AAF0D2J1_ODILC|nr:MAG: EamA family transporter [Candidatus Odinarchaeum yellowstonii]
MLQIPLENLFISVILAVIASAIFGIATPLFKRATMAVGEIRVEEFKKDFKGNLRKLLNKYMAIAIALQLGAWLIFLMAISRYQVSIIVPILSTTYIFTAFYANRFFKEKLSWREILGILIIIIGVIILTYPF